jgi:RimJ/RimL family protein N-acetyltransferase
MSETALPQQLRPAEAAEFQRFPDGQAYLEAVRVANVTEEDLHRVVEICNQPLILDHLKQTLTDGQPYTMNFAQDLVHVGEMGWETGAGFVYFIRDAQRRVVGAMDIKSNDLDAEIGAWTDAESPGYVTNAVACLTELARQAGFNSLYSLVDPNNDRSIAVMRRSGWQEFVERDGQRELLHFSLALTTDSGATDASA